MEHTPGVVTGDDLRGSAPGRIQLVWAHPRTNSLTATVAGDVRELFERRGFEVDALDLYRVPFSAELREADEPDWLDLDRVYDPVTMDLIERTAQANAIVFVFPVWWYSFPAIMKGYIDRVWNHGYFYGGGRRIGVDSVLWLGLAGDTRQAYQSRDYHRMMEHHLNVGIAGYCGFEYSEVVLLYNTLGEGVEDMAAYTGDVRRKAVDAAARLLERVRRAAHGLGLTTGLHIDS